VAIFEAGAGVFIDNLVGHGHSNVLVVSKRNGTENTGGKSLSLMGRVLVSQVYSVVPRDGWGFHMLLFKGVK
jgi:hypothetical protein